MHAGISHQPRVARRRLQCAAAVASLLSLIGCDTASVRVPGLSLAFPPTTPDVRASAHTQEALFVEAPKDTRADHIGEDVAKSGWTACATDTLASGDLQPLVRERPIEAITQAGIFGAVNTSSAKYVSTPSAPARLNASSDSIITLS